MQLTFVQQVHCSQQEGSAREHCPGTAAVLLLHWEYNPLFVLGLHNTLVTLLRICKSSRLSQLLEMPAVSLPLISTLFPNI